MKRLSVVAALGLALALGACSDDNDGNDGTPDSGTGNNAPSHLGGTATANGTCDNPKEAPNTCYAYVGSNYADFTASDCDGTFSRTQGCTATGRGGRCTLLAGTVNEYVAHCYNSTSQCQSTCTALDGVFAAN
jgi:hypothetical protein